MFAHDMLWVEKYQPKSVENCVLSAANKAAFTQIVQTGNMPNMLFGGGPGCGKTTVARALAHEMGMEVIFRNATLNNSIDTIRTDLKQFASTISITGQRKLVILDEADGLSNSAQEGLRGFIDEASKNCRFIFTCNYKNKIIEPLHSRLTYHDFTIPQAEKKPIAGEILKILVAILKKEGVEYDLEVMKSLVIRLFPDFRKMINELQKFSKLGSIDSAIMGGADSDLRELTKIMRSKEFRKMREWVAKNPNVDFHAIVRSIFNNSYDLIDDGADQAMLVYNLAKSQVEYPNAVNKDVHLAGLLTELMALKWK